VKERFLAHWQSEEWVLPGATVLVGYSGGADSTALLTLLKECGVDVVAAHLHHGMRPEADAEADACAAYAESLGIPFVIGRADVPGLATDRKIGLEEAGREARYAFFRQAALQTGADSVATGHTADDHAETVLLHLLRGAGLRGLSGIPAKRDNIIRPLLPFRRAETRDFCTERGLWFHDDPANDDLRFTRSRLRHRIAPELTEIQPAWVECVARAAALIAEEDGFLNGAAAAALERAEQPLNGPLRFLTQHDEVAFRRPELTHLPRVLFRRAIRLAVEAVGGSLDYHQTEAVADGMFLPKGSVTDEGQRVRVEWDDERVHVRSAVPSPSFRHPLEFPGATDAESLGWRLEVEESERTERPPRAALTAWFDRDRLKGPLWFRSAQDGDRISPLGFDGHRKVRDLMAEAGLTKAARERLPVVGDLLGILWVPGVCLDNRAVNDEPGRPALRITLGPSAS